MSSASKLFLVGFMGSGKSSVGSLLAARMDWGFADTDRLVETREGRSIEAIFKKSGEGYFRKAEWEALQTLQDRDRLVVATGGGLFLGVAQRDWIRRNGRSIWLDANLETIRRRVGQGTGRPRWDSSDSVDFQSFFEKRRAAYALAQDRVEVSSLSAEEVVRCILTGLGGGDPGPGAPDRNM